MTSLEPFHAFDKAALAEADRAAPTTFTESLRRLKALIDKLPQRPIVEDRHAERWLNRCVEMAIARMELEHGEGNATIADVHAHVLWHVRRASAIGGSEIGAVVRHFRGERGGFTNARNLVLEKLLVLAPQPGDEAMNRGVRAEPWLQRMFLEETGATSDEKALDVLKGFRWDKAPQIVGTPDDLVVFADGKVKIIDYKCPSADVNAEYEKKGMVSFDYACQVHQYAVIAKVAGIKFNGMEVVCFDPRSFRLKSYAIDPDPSLVAEIVKGSRTLWNDFVMKGELPEVPGPGRLETDDEDARSEMERLTMQAAVLKVIADEVVVRQNEALSRVKAIGKDAHELNEGKIDLGFAAFDRKRVWDEEILVNLAIGVGLEPEDYMVATKKFDAEEGEKLLKEIFAAPEGDAEGLARLVKDMRASGGLPYKRALDAERLIADLEEIGVSTTPAAGISERFTLSRAKKNLDKVRLIKNEAVKLADTIEDVVENEAQNMLRDHEDVVDDEDMIEP